MRRFAEAREEAKRIPFETETQNPHSLHGLQISVKDYNDIAGITKTFRSPIFCGHFPEISGSIVQKLMDNEAIVAATANVRNELAAIR